MNKELKTIRRSFHQSQGQALSPHFEISQIHVLDNRRCPSYLQEGQRNYCLCFGLLHFDRSAKSAYFGLSVLFQLFQNHNEYEALA